MEYCPPTLTIDADEFDFWVRGAMAECSDDGKAPDFVTYDYVMNLADTIRNSLQGQ